ncbi:MAG: sensor histidine kinase [Candidatus Dormibacteria bacterium]
MNAPQLQRVHTVSTRVALATTAIVACVYAVIAIVVVVIATRNLTADVDGRLTSALSRVGRDQVRAPGEGFVPPPGGPRFGPPLLVWTVLPGGVVATNDPNAPLPDDYRFLDGHRTISVGGTDVRVAGVSLGRAHVVVGQTMDSVSMARSNIITAELLVGPILLVVVFLGALAIARRAAAPFELARQRQMEFTADASHELRTPLSVIEAQTSLALAQSRDTAWYARAFQRVDVESKRIRRLVEDLLWLARFEGTGGRQPPAEHVDVGVLAEQAADRFATVAETRGLRLAAHVGTGSHAVTAPPEWLHRLLGVLLDNACKYAPEGGSVDLSVSSGGGAVRLIVDDSGPGIAPEHRPRIFDRFHRAVEGPGGAGLGLAIADAVVRATGGRWEVGTSPAGGARMAVTWPAGMP